MSIAEVGLSQLKERLSLLKERIILFKERISSLFVRSTTLCPDWGLSLLPRFGEARASRRVAARNGAKRREAARSGAKQRDFVAARRGYTTRRDFVPPRRAPHAEKSRQEHFPPPPGQRRAMPCHAMPCAMLLLLPHCAAPSRRKS